MTDKPNALSDEAVQAAMKNISQLVTRAAITELRRAMQFAAAPDRSLSTVTCATAILRETIGVLSAIDADATDDLIFGIAAALRDGAASDQVASFQLDAQNRLARADMQRQATSLRGRA